MPPPALDAQPVPHPPAPQKPDLVPPKPDFLSLDAGEPRINPAKLGPFPPKLGANTAVGTGDGGLIDIHQDGLDG